MMKKLNIDKRKDVKKLPQSSHPAISKGWRHAIHVVMDGTDTPMGKWFDIALLIAVLASVTVVMLDSVRGFHLRYQELFYYAEWGFTFLFTIEYVLRVFSAPNRLRYMVSFFGIVDLLAILPSYISALTPLTLQALLVVRILRILRIFRILNMADYLQQAGFFGDGIDKQ